MRLNKFSLVILVLLARTNQGEIVVGKPSLNASISRLFEDLVNIVTSCYEDRINAVGLVGNLPDTFIRTLMVQYSIPVALTNNPNPNPLSGLRDVPIQFRQKLHVFIVGASSAKELSNTIRMNRYFIWWNHMASYFILDLSPGCANHASYLHAAWRQNILNAKVICRSRKEKTLIMTCNPFTSQAPVAWHQLRVFSADTRIPNKSRPFAVFFREYRGNKAICTNLDFDKSNDLGGYEVFIDGYDEDELVPNFHKYKDAYKLFTANKRILSIIVHSLKGTLEPLDRRNSRRLNGDIRLHPIWMNGETWDFDLITYPHGQVGFILVSQFRGHKSQLNKILTVVDVNSRIGMGIVYLITLIFLKFFVHQTLVPAILNLIRITCDTGFTNLPDNNATRIFLTGLLFFVVTMQGIYQGNLASLLTTIIPLRDIETMQDVVDFDYKIYGNAASKMVVDHPDLRERYIYAKDGDCITHVTNDPSAVCFLIAAGAPLDMVRMFGLHTSSEFIVRSYIGFKIKWDRPFEQRINMIIKSLVESDTLEPWNIQCAPTELTEFRFDEAVKKNEVFKNIELGELTFAFVILGIGLVCATITFIIEVSIEAHKSRIVTVRVHRLN